MQTVTPPDKSFASTKQSLLNELNDLFPTDSFRFTHAIELIIPGSHSAILTGVVNIHPQCRAIHCEITTPEGLVLFEADHTGKKSTIHRAVTPFDNQTFAQGLVSDIALIFLKPRGKLTGWGKIESKNRILKFSDPGRGTIDIITSPDRTVWTQNTRTCGRQLKRSVKYLFPQMPTNSNPPVFPKTITLTAEFPSRYTLTMTLTNANLISGTPPCGDRK